MSDNKEVTCPRLRLWKYPHMAKVLKCSSLVVLMESWNNCRKLGSPAKPCVCTLRSLLPEPTLYHSYMIWKVILTLNDAILSATQSFGMISLRRVLVSFFLRPSLSATQGFWLISLRRVFVIFRLSRFPSATQSFWLISLRSVLVSFFLRPSLSATQGFWLISLRRVFVIFRLSRFPSATQSFGLISLRRGIGCSVCVVV